MDPRDRNTIQRNIIKLSRGVSLEPLYKELLDRNIILYNDVEKLRKMYPAREEQAQEFFLRYTKRGPRAFPILIETLRKTGHESEANLLAENAVTELSGYDGATVEPTELFSSTSTSPSLSIGSTPEGSPLPKPSRLAQVTMEDIPPLEIKIQPAKIYNNRVSIDDCYQMMSQPRGFALVINNIEFIGDPSSTRAGAERDTENLDAVLKLLHFEVTIRCNVKKTDLLQKDGIIDTFISQFNRSDVDCCIVAVMSHGTEGYFMTSDPESLNPDQNRVSIWNEFLPRFNNRNCPILHNKPKIFILQACRGEVKDRGVLRTLTDSVGSEEDKSDSSEGSGRQETSSSSSEGDRMPTFEDMVVCQSTVPGFVSNRDTERGTWYIDSLCSVLCEHAHDMELTKMLRMVGRRMRMICSEYGDKQMCSFNNTGFHYDLYFNPGLFKSTLTLE